MSRVVEGHLVGFDELQDFEESPEMEAPAEDDDMLSAREERIERDDYISRLRASSKRKKRTLTVQRSRTR